MAHILLIEDDVSFSMMLERFLRKNGFEVQSCSSGASGLDKVKQHSFDLVFTDLRLPDLDGITLLEKLQAESPSVPVILMTGYAQVSTAVEAMKKGAFDYISKPFNQEEVLVVIQNALKTSTSAKIEEPVAATEGRKGTTVTGIGPASRKLNEYIQLVAPTNLSVLITGNSGTGKEVVARRIHENSHRSTQNFVAVDCGAIPKEIAASEFFGHLKGSFTGAVSDKKGHFEAANGGTIFLDEVGNLSYENQIQLLRALQERKIKPIGSSAEITVDIRLITATNEDLTRAVAQGNFREDLYHRLNEFSIRVPDLQERKEDLMIFADHFLNLANAQLQKQVLGFSPEVLKRFQEYHWPGNLRELSNVIKRSALLTQGDYIEADVLPSEIGGSVTLASPTERRRSFSARENEKELILSALAEVDNNKSKAARLLNITRKTLYNKLKEYNIGI